MTKQMAIYILGLVMGTLLGLTIAFVAMNLHEQNSRNSISAEESSTNSLNDNSELLIRFCQRLSEYDKQNGV